MDKRFAVLRIAARLDHRLTTALPTLPTATHVHLLLYLTYLTTRGQPYGITLRGLYKDGGALVTPQIALYLSFADFDLTSNGAYR